MRYIGSKFWNEMPEKIKSDLWISYTTFVLCKKEFLKGDQYLLVFFTVYSLLFCFYLLFKVCLFFFFLLVFVVKKKENYLQKVLICN